MLLFLKVCIKTQIEMSAVRRSATGNVSQMPSSPNPPILGKMKINGVTSSTHLRMASRNAALDFPIA